MLTREQWILGISVAILAISVASFVLLVRRFFKRADTDVILDAVDGVRDQVDSHQLHTQREHESIAKGVDKANGRLQWLIADKIAEELGVARDKAKKEMDGKDPPEGA